MMNLQKGMGTQTIVIIIAILIVIGIAYYFINQPATEAPADDATSGEVIDDQDTAALDATDVVDTVEGSDEDGEEVLE